MPRGRPAGNPEPTERELEVMSVLWSLGSGTVAEVREAFMERYESEPAYTTVLTQLRALVGKGWLRAEARGRAHRYVPIVTSDDAKPSAIGRVIDLLYNGSRDLFLTELVSDRRLRPQTLMRLRHLLEERLQERSR